MNSDANIAAHLPVGANVVNGQKIIGFVEIFTSSLSSG